MEKTTRQAPISEEERYQLIGLRAVMQELDKQEAAVMRAALRITQEIDDKGDPEEAGYTLDYLTNYRTLEDLQRILGIAPETQPSAPLESSVVEEQENKE